MPETTPMLRQYLEIKAAYPEAILFFRLGDFYEMFFDDAKTASGILNIALTSRDGTVPMCGVPAHAAENYLFKLVGQGFRVAICEQMEEPGGAGIIRREVVRVVSRGTLLETSLLREKRNNFLLALTGGKNGIGLAVVDVSTGVFLATQFEGKDATFRALEETERLNPVEVLLDPALTELKSALAVLTKASLNDHSSRAFQSRVAEGILLEHFGVASMDAFGCAGLRWATAAAGGLLAYLTETQKSSLEQLERLQTYFPTERMVLDAYTRRNLELVRRLNGDEDEGTLFWALDETVTPMGGRFLRQLLERPYVRLEQIRERLEAVGELVEDASLRSRLREGLRQVKDLERQGARVAARLTGPRELLSLGASLSVLPRLKESMVGVGAAVLRRLAGGVDSLTDVAKVLREAIAPDAPTSGAEGGIIRSGYSAEVDRLRELGRAGAAWVAELEGAERERTGIRSLKVGYNRVFGYYLEVTRANLNAVPPEYQRRQTLASVERFITPELKDKETAMLEAEARLLEVELGLFGRVQDLVRAAASRILGSARALADLDLLASFAEVAAQRGYVRPEVDEGESIEVREGRHPVLERVLGPGNFVPNDTVLNNEERLQLLTGPNMGGKSTYMRQVALLVLLAQMGSFVPAKAARIGIVDRVFTRVGASDDLAGGKSTFMVEMSELAHILKTANKKSLLLLDEIGRGTSTFDGLSIAWAVAEHIHERIGAKTIFATHYHELLDLEDTLGGMRNCAVAVHEEGEKIVFLHRIISGRGERSYGIQVARLAGIPEDVLRRARNLLASLEAKAVAPREVAVGAEEQLVFFHRPTTDPLRDELAALDLANLTPLAALNLLQRWQDSFAPTRGEMSRWAK